MPNSPSPLTDDDRNDLRHIGEKVRARLAANAKVHKLPVDKAEVWALPDFFDAIECGRLMVLIDAVARPSPLADADGYGSDFRTSYTGDLLQQDPFVAKVQRRIDDLLGIDGSFGEPLQGQRYHPGQEFKPHSDWFAADTAYGRRERARAGQRSITAMAYLNPVEAGGATEFPHLQIAVDPRPGMLLAWNNADVDGVPNPWTIHAGTPVVRGVKYVITKWYRSRPFG